MVDKRLLDEIRKNPARFSEVYDKYYQRIFNYVFKRTRSFDVAKDITSETFLKAFLNISKFTWRGIALRSWLYQIATNEISLHYRNKKYRPGLLTDLGYPVLPEANQADLLEEKELAEQEMDRHNDFIKVREAVASLPSKYQEVISLKYFEKLKIKEISQILNKPEGTVKSLLSRGLQRLRKEL